MRKSKSITKKQALKKITSLVAAAAMLITGIPDMGPVKAASGEKAVNAPDKLCELTFDAENELEAGAAKADAPASYDTVEHEGGKALSQRPPRAKCRSHIGC